MSGSRKSKLLREIVRPAKQLTKLIHRSTSQLYSPYLYDLTLRRKVQVSRGAVGLKKHVAIYAIAPFHGVWPSHLMALDYLLASGISPIVVSNSPLSDQEKNSISDRAALVIERPNYGYDFGAFREGWLYLRDHLENTSRVTMLNDSVWFPAPGSANWFDAVEQQGTMITGAASNFGGERKVPEALSLQHWKYSSRASNFHLQSFALSFSSEAIRDPALTKFWASYPMVNNKELTVQRGEIGLSQWALAQGWSASSTYPVESMDTLINMLAPSRLQEIAENTIVLGNPAFLELKQHVLGRSADPDTLKSFILAAARCLGVGFALPEFNLREMKFPFLKKSPVWHQKEASDITLRVIRETQGNWEILEEAEFLRRTLLY